MMKTYVEQELTPLGCRTESSNDSAVIMRFQHITLLFKCVCPAYPQIKAFGCPVHAHETSLPGSWSVEQAKNVARCLGTAT